MTNSGYDLLLLLYSSISGMIFGLAAWYIKNIDDILTHKKSTIVRLAISYSLISGLISSSVAVYLNLEYGINPLLAILLGSIASIFTKLLMQQGEKLLVTKIKG